VDRCSYSNLLQGQASPMCVNHTANGQPARAGWPSTTTAPLITTPSSLRRIGERGRLLCCPSLAGHLGQYTHSYRRSERKQAPVRSGLQSRDASPSRDGRNDKQEQQHAVRPKPVDAIARLHLHRIPRAGALRRRCSQLSRTEGGDGVAGACSARGQPRTRGPRWSTD